MPTPEQVKRVRNCAEQFVRVYDEFDGDPCCVGEYLDALETAVGALTDDTEDPSPRSSEKRFSRHLEVNPIEHA